MSSKLGMFFTGKQEKKPLMNNIIIQTTSSKNLNLSEKSNSETKSLSFMNFLELSSNKQCGSCMGR